MTTLPPLPAPVRIGIVSISDRASTGVYEDKGRRCGLAGAPARCNPIEFEGG